MKKLTIGILAHVDAGKTTLSEGLLYAAGALRTLGRVDHGDAFLDTEALERERGITIFAKQAVLDCGGTHITLLDTPGHVDFSAEAERTLQVLDYAILVISGTDGVQGHTRTLWGLLAAHHIPAFLFFNKMDLPGADKAALLASARAAFGDAAADADILRAMAALTRCLFRRPAALPDHVALGSSAQALHWPPDAAGSLWGEEIDALRRELS